jgi:hypothetical protein
MACVTLSVVLYMLRLNHNTSLYLLVPATCPMSLNKLPLRIVSGALSRRRLSYTVEDIGVEVVVGVGDGVGVGVGVGVAVDVGAVPGGVEGNSGGGEGRGLLKGAGDYVR